MQRYEIWKSTHRDGDNILIAFSLIPESLPEEAKELCFQQEELIEKHLVAAFMSETYEQALETFDRIKAGLKDEERYVSVEEWMQWMRENGRPELLKPVEAGCRVLDPPCPNCGDIYAYPPADDPHGDKPCGFCVLCCDRGRCDEVTNGQAV